MMVVLSSLSFTAGAAEAAPNYRGINMHALWSSVSNSDMDRELDLAKQAGVNVIRVDVGWSSLETEGKGQISDWYRDKLDRFVSAADSRGIKVLPTLWATPCWASSAPETLKQGCAGSWWDRGVQQYPPNNASDYGDIARWMTSRYGSKLAALEVWNEPSLSGTRFWVAPDRAGAYATLLKAAYPAAKAGNSSVAVLVALDGTDRDFLGAIYDRGIAGAFDGVAAHPYGDRNFTNLKALHDFQRQHGDDTPVWVTEFGWPTGGGGSGVTADDQATRITDSYKLLGNLDWVRAALLYELRDEGTDASYDEDNYGVVKRDFTPKPGYTALRTALTGQAPPTDGTLPPLDGTIPPADGTVPPVDGTVPPVDGTVPPVDGTTPPSGDDPPPADGGDDGGGGGGGGNEVKLELVRRGNKLVATGTAPAGQTVQLERHGCSAASDQTVSVRADSRGSFQVVLGKRSKLGGCSFDAALA